ncbi:MAG TPA: hypothetical protein VNZ52_01680 [Candidatus Thermoplasmatota archaeon]|nr:hypothetical protein [Candidatus Thermoplasmatota archaeon]
MRYRALPLALGAVLLLVLAAAPLGHSAPGDRVTLHLDEVKRLDPERAKAVNLTVTLCAGGGLPLSPGPREVVLTVVESPAWLRWEFTPGTLQFTPLLPNECQRQSGLLRLNATRGAPGFEPASIVVRAALKGDEGLGYQENVTFMSGFLGDLAIHAPAGPLTVPEGGSAATAVHVQNRGNAPTRVRIEAVGAPRGVAVNVEGDATIPAFGEGDPDHAFPVTIVLGEGAPAEPFEVRLLVTSNYPYDAETQGDGGLIVIPVVPGPPVDDITKFRLPDSPTLLALAAVGGALLAGGVVVRRWRKARQA